MNDIMHWMARAEAKDEMTAFDYFTERAQPLPPPMMKQTVVASTAAANTNENEDPAVGQFEYWARTAIRDLVQVKGYDNARAHVAMILNDLAGGRRNG